MEIFADLFPTWQASLCIHANMFYFMNNVVSRLLLSPLNEEYCCAWDGTWLLLASCINLDHSIILPWSSCWHSLRLAPSTFFLSRYVLLPCYNYCTCYLVFSNIFTLFCCNSSSHIPILLVLIVHFIENNVTVTSSTSPEAGELLVRNGRYLITSVG